MNTIQQKNDLLALLEKVMSESEALPYGAHKIEHESWKLLQLEIADIKAEDQLAANQIEAAQPQLAKNIAAIEAETDAKGSEANIEAKIKDQREARDRVNMAEADCQKADDALKAARAVVAEKARPISLAHVRVDTTEFECSHGRKPRGEGCWGFDFGSNHDVNDIEFAPGTLLYSEAKQWAKKEAADRGISFIAVSP